MTYTPQFDNDVVHPVMRGYKMQCCDCSLVHRFNFYVVKSGRGKGVAFKVWRDKRATAASRRKKR